MTEQPTIRMTEQEFDIWAANLARREVARDLHKMADQLAALAGAIRANADRAAAEHDPGHLVALVDDSQSAIRWKVANMDPGLGATAMRYVAAINRLGLSVQDGARIKTVIDYAEASGMTC